MRRSSFSLPETRTRFRNKYIGGFGEKKPEMVQTVKVGNEVGPGILEGSRMSCEEVKEEPKVDRCEGR